MRLQGRIIRPPQHPIRDQQPCRVFGKSTADGENARHAAPFSAIAPGA